MDKSTKLTYDLHSQLMLRPVSVINLVKLLDHGADINYELNGYTPIIQACFSRRDGTAMVEEDKQLAKVVQLLIDRGASVNKPAKSGYTPLQIAAQHGFMHITKTLLVNGADINNPGYIGNTALMDAALFNNKELVEYLLQQGAEIDKLNEGGSTALTMAALANNNELVFILMGAGANIKFIEHAKEQMNKETVLSIYEYAKRLKSEEALVKHRDKRSIEISDDIHLT